MKTTIKILLLLIFIVTVINMCNSSNTEEIIKEDVFSSEWRDAQYGNEMLSISRSIVHANITGCGLFKVKQSDNNPYNYLVACTNMNNPITWNYYIVNVNIETIETFYGNIDEPILD